MLLLYNHADYLWQGEMHGWTTWLDLTARAPKWGLWDFIPHDAWHAVQSIKNHSLLFGAPCLVLSTDKRFWGFVILIAGYSLTRAIGFTLFL